MIKAKILFYIYTSGSENGCMCYLCRLNKK